jgi:hypothetical protein
MKLILLSCAALFMSGLRNSFATANAAADPVAAVGDELAQLKDLVAKQTAQISELQKQLGVATAPKLEGETPLDLMIKGAKLNPDRVKWRVASGLTPEQAIAAERQQKSYDAAKNKAEGLAASQKAAAEKAAAKGK